MNYELSMRLQRLSPSATLAMSQRSSELKAQGVDVINMSVGEPDFNTPDHIKAAAIKAVEENYSRYSPVPGYPELKKAIVAKLKNENGLDYASLKDKYPSLVMAQISSYGLKGPQADQPGQDTISFWVSTGFTADMMVKTDNSYPVYGSSGTGDFITGIGLAYAIVCALYKRKETGLGDYVVNSLYGMGLWCNSNYNMGCTSRYTWKMPKTRDVSAPASSPYLCSDGEWIMSTVVDVNAQWSRFANAVGRPDWICEEYGTVKAQANPAVRKYLIEECEKIFATKTSKEWDEILTKHDVVHDVLAHFGDYEKKEQALVNGYAFYHTYPNGHETCLIRPPMTSERMGTPEFIPGAMTGEHSEEVMAELGYSPEEIKHLEEVGAIVQIDKSLYNK